MLAKDSLTVSLIVASALPQATDATTAPVPAEVVLSLADQLVEQQAASGAWLGEESQTGTIVAGLVAAYELTCDGRYIGAASAGADFFNELAGGVFLGDEAYALTRLIAVSGDEAADWWASAVDTFYTNVKRLAAGSTAGYISQFGQTELSGAVFYLAHHAVAAHAIGAEDAEVWRQGLLEYLARVEDSTSQLPVMSLGAATWALASTGSLNESLIDPGSKGANYWRGRMTRELPQLLMEHQVEFGAPLAGSFYWRFDHGSDGTPGGAVSGYVEDLVFGMLGLEAAERASPQPETARAIGAARDVLLGSLEGSAVARQHVSENSDSWYVYSGHVLEALAQVVSRADVNLSGCVDNVDFSLWAKRWRGPGYFNGCVASRCDFNRDGRVHYEDLALMAREWLE